MTSSVNLQLSSLDRKLMKWLDDEPSKFERYIEKHPEAADRIDQLLSLGLDAQRAISEALTDSLAAPVDLLARLSERVVPGNDTAVASVMLDIFGVGGETVRTWFDTQS
jgi:hypothetical protein